MKKAVFCPLGRNASLSREEAFRGKRSVRCSSDASSKTRPERAPSGGPSSERIGRRASAATLVFSLESAKEFAPLARTLYTLRKTRGRHLKLIVVPDKAPVRATSLAFLLGCGANVVFETSAGIEFIGMTLAQMRDAVFTRVLPEDFEASLDFVLAAHARGVLDRNEFTELVRRLVTFSETNFVPLNRGTLVTLEPAETLNPEDCLAQFQPKRAGDIACAAERRCAVFLNGSHPANVELALERCFAVEPAELFAHYSLVFETADILSELRAIETFRESPTGETARRTFALRTDVAKTDDASPRPNPIIPTPADFLWKK